MREFEQVDELLSPSNYYLETVLDAFYERKRPKRSGGGLLKFEPIRPR